MDLLQTMNDVWYEEIREKELVPVVGTGQEIRGTPDLLSLLR